MNLFTKNYKCVTLAFFALSFAFPALAQKADYQVVPLPRHVQEQVGEFVLQNGVKVMYPKGNAKMQNNADFLAEYVNELTGIKLKPVAGKSSGGTITLAIDSKIKNKEGYRLVVNPKSVTIYGQTPAGVFYGIQTLRKSLPVDVQEKVILPSVIITDEPRFEYRGMMLDCARHFFPVSFVKKYIDILALHNINTFHWHITDDQGWRFEVKRYPGLVEIGSKRDETVIGHNTEKYDGIPYGGYYSQADCKDIVAYAAKRYINVMPEIDMPGHMMGALAAYPELGCTGGPYKVWTKWGVSEDVLCVGNPKTLEFIKNVLAELIQVFPSKMIHVGGDECPKVRWKECPKCQAKAKELGIVATKEHTVEEQLQSYFIKEAEKFLNAHGRSMIGWDETLEGGLAPNASIMSWRGVKGGIEAAKQHHDVVMSPTTYCYFDYYQSKDQAKEPMAIGGFLPVKKVYSYEPYAPELTPEEAKYIKGVQANLWTEYIPDPKQAEYMVLPRMDAVSEIQWIPAEQKNYSGFLKRMPRMLSIYDRLNYNYAKHILDEIGR